MKLIGSYRHEEDQHWKEARGEKKQTVEVRNHRLYPQMRFYPMRGD